MNRIFLICAIIFFGYCNAQNIENTNGQVMSVGFNYPNPTGCVAVNEPTLPANSQWTFQGSPPSLCTQLPPFQFIDTPANVTGVYLALTTDVINGVSSNQQTLTGRFSSLAPGLAYDFSFYCANFGPTSATTSGDWASQFEVTIGDTTYWIDVPELEEGETSHWQKISFELCATAAIENFSISSPRILNDEPNMSVNLAIDFLSFKGSSRNTCTTPTPEPCIDCTSFRPVPGHKYVLDGWVKLGDESSGSFVDLDVFKYEGCSIDVTFKTTDGDESPTIAPIVFSFSPQGDIIEGWQKIHGEFTVPEAQDFIEIALVNTSGYSGFFDDIRVHPYDSNLKSFVYDEQSNKLVAELDENNYASLYEYDQEGGLVRVKKETQRGVLTIQESRSGTAKK